MTETLSQVAALRRRLGVVGLTLYGLGVTVGAGIYVLIGKVAGLAGGATPFAFIAAAAVAGMTAMSFAELCARLPRSAGEALYVREGLGSETLSLLTGLAVVAVGLVAAATVLLGASGYLAALVPLPIDLIAVLLVALLGGLAIWGIAESVVAIGLVTVIEISGLVAILVVAAPAALSGGPPPAAAAAPVAGGAAGFLGAVTIAFFAFIGFEGMVNVVEEVKRPERTMPLAIAATLGLTTLLYLALVVVSLAVVPPAELAASHAPLGLVFESASGLSAAPFVVVAVLATINGGLALVIMASRVLYGLARDGALPAVLGRVWQRSGTPVPATLLVCAVVLGGALALPIATLAQAGSVLTLAIFCLVNLALVALKRRAPAAPGQFAVPAWWPGLAGLTCLAVLVGEGLRLLA